MARRDIITGEWTASVKPNEGGLDLVKYCVKLKGYDRYCYTHRANGLLGIFENIKFNKKGHMKADLYEGRNYVGKVRLHKKAINFDDNYDGRLKFDARMNTITMFDDDIRSGWVAKVFGAGDLF